MAEPDTHLSFFTVILIVCIIFIVGCLGVYCGCHIWVAATSSSITYSISATGFENASTGEPAVLYFPLPVVDETPAFSPDRYNRTFDGWISRVSSTDYGDMLEFTSIAMPLKDINAVFREENIFYPEMVFSHHVPERNDLSLTFNPQISSVPSSHIVTIDEVVQEVYEARNDTYPTLIYLPQELSCGNVEIYLHYQIHTPRSVGSLLAGRLSVDQTSIHERINTSGTSGWLTASPRVRIGFLPPLYSLILIDPPKGSRPDDFVLFRPGTHIPGQTMHYDYSVLPNTTKLFIALQWDDPEYPMQLYTISPSGIIFGPYTDTYDGEADGLIPLSITSSYTLQGEWSIEVTSREKTGAHHQQYQLHVREY